MLETMSATNEVMTNVATGWLDGFGMPPAAEGILWPPQRRRIQKTAAAAEARVEEVIFRSHQAEPPPPPPPPPLLRSGRRRLISKMCSLSTTQKWSRARAAAANLKNQRTRRRQSVRRGRRNQKVPEIGIITRQSM